MLTPTLFARHENCESIRHCWLSFPLRCSSSSRNSSVQLPNRRRFIESFTRTRLSVWSGPFLQNKVYRWFALVSPQYAISQAIDLFFAEQAKQPVSDKALLIKKEE